MLSDVVTFLNLKFQKLTQIGAQNTCPTRVITKAFYFILKGGPSPTVSFS